MQIALRMNETSLETTYNMTSQLINPQESIENFVLLKNNQPLIMLSFCLFIIIFCTCLSLFIYSKWRKNNKSLFDENLDFETNKNFKIKNELLRSYYLG